MSVRRKLSLNASDWPGVVGAEDPKMTAVPMEEMVSAIGSARVGNARFDGIDLILAAPTSDAEIFLGPGMTPAQYEAALDHLRGNGLLVGALVSPSWGEACRPFGTAAQCAEFVNNVAATAAIGMRLERSGMRVPGSSLIRVDSGTQCTDPSCRNMDKVFERLVETLTRATKAARAYGQQLVFEPEAPWPWMNTIPAVERLLSAVPDIGVQVDLAHFLHLLCGTADRSTSILPADWSWTRPTETEAATSWDSELERAWKRVATKFGDRVLDLHVSQSNGTVFGGGDHPPTGRHCHPADPTGVIDVPAVAKLFLTSNGEPHGRLSSITWDGCMIGQPEDRATLLRSTEFWNAVLAMMIKVRDNAGYAPLAA